MGPTSKPSLNTYRPRLKNIVRPVKIITITVTRYRLVRSTTLKDMNPKRKKKKPMKKRRRMMKMTRMKLKNRKLEDNYVLKFVDCQMCADYECLDFHESSSNGYYDEDGEYVEAELDDAMEWLNGFSECAET